MKNLMFSLIAFGAFSIVAMPTQSIADPNVHIGIGLGDGGDGYGHWRHHRHRCHWVPVWRHHHRMMIQQCGWGGEGMHGSMHMGY